MVARNCSGTLATHSETYPGFPFASVLGSVEHEEALAVSEIYLSRHQNARQWQDFADFTYYRLVLSNAYFIGGFGVMGWITAQQFQEQLDLQ